MYTSQLNSWIEPFNRREVEILDLISDGLSNREISLKLHLSPETIKWYNKQIFAKLGANSRTQAVKIASEHQFLTGWKTVSASEVVSLLGNLPAQLNSFVGRVKEIAEIRQLLKTSRLVTLVGPGGCGKSRLALQVAAGLSGSFPEGAWLVELASVNDPALVTSAITKVLKVNAISNIPLDEILKRFLSQRHLLLILDNFEHLSEAIPLVGELLAAAPRVTILATSRERLHVYGEQIYPVHPLSLPDLQRTQSTSELFGYEAVELFVHRAQAARPGFAVDDIQMKALAQICVRLDGLPLAIELAASQVSTYPPVVLAQLLEGNLDNLLSGPRNLPERQRTLRATLEWSYKLLTEEQKTLLNRMAIFSGGGRLESIEQVCGWGLPGKFMAHLNALVEVNLLYPREDFDGQLRFTMLETIREYASEKLSASGELQSILNHHAAYFTALAESADKEMRSARQTYWFARLADDQDNLRSILNWSLNGGEVEYGLRLAAALRDFWYHNAMGTEGLRWCEQAIARSSDAEPRLRAPVLRSAGQLASILINTDR
jgi:predicted ATPase/DNA-binding CsgD family transcriptional regulator